MNGRKSPAARCCSPCPRRSFALRVMAAQRRNRLRIRIARGFLTSRSAWRCWDCAGPVARGRRASSPITTFNLAARSISGLPARFIRTLPAFIPRPGISSSGETLRASDLTRLLWAPATGRRPPGSRGISRHGSTVEIRPSADSYFPEAMRCASNFSGTEIAHISQISDGAELDSARDRARANHESLRQLARKAARIALRRYSALAWSTQCWRPRTSAFSSTARWT